MQGLFTNLSLNQVANLKDPVSSDPEVENKFEHSASSLVERIRKCRKVEMVSSNNYMDNRFSLPTSNICERFFSEADFILSDRRNRISPTSFEEQVFLHVNNSW